MNIRAFAYLFVVLILLNTGCKKKSDIEEQRYLWSTEEPLTIPLRLRIQRHEKGNLIRNPSFETGKIFRLDSANSSFVIDGWQQIGRNTQWVDIGNDSLYQPNEAYSAKRSVKISRMSAYETASEGDGILSDFIKVIPGNYSLSLFARMENVKPNRARLGTRMYDGIEISVRYFDRNKNLLKPVVDYPIENQKIDASFKALSFANYKQIRSLGWSKIIGKSHAFPFPEGDIPTEAHFVKIYIGLKGTGTVWIDSVSFSFTSRNFSAAERMQTYTDTAFRTGVIILPTPKTIVEKQSIVFGAEGMTEAQLPLILVSDPASNDAANMIRDALSKRLPAKMVPKIITSITDAQIERSLLILSIGHTQFYRQFQTHLPEKEIAGRPQGYFIFSPDDSRNLVLLGSDTREGIYNAALTVVQMIDSRQPVLHNARIIDYPDYSDRYCTLASQSDIKQVPELIRYKINGAFVLDRPVIRSVMLSGVEAYSDRSVMLSGVEAYSNSGLFKIIPVSGYVPPPASLFYDYPYTVGSDTIPRITRKYEFPAVFHNEMLDNSDYAEMCCQLEVTGKKLYSGSSFFSLNTDAADAERFKSIFGPSPVFFDNSMLISTAKAGFGANDPHYPGKARLFNIFEPFNNTGIRELYHLLDTSVYAVNLPPESEIEIIRLATAADFLWNMNSYSMDYSLWKVLVSRYGEVNASDLIKYADQYSLLLETLMRLEKNIQPARNWKIGQNAITQITSLTSEISARLGSQHKLIKVLHLLNSNLRNRLNQNRSIIPAR